MKLKRDNFKEKIKVQIKIRVQTKSKIKNIAIKNRSKENLTKSMNKK